ncbi:hypothetical protein ACFQE5_04800 [Pseudonocardia hispaniensis]|uniref:TniQ protein n=1 Tax=Pseudonocardia hispaniensis TaxID=904933 RepID=A0ABW1IZ87_9PSEU
MTTRPDPDSGPGDAPSGYRCRRGHRCPHRAHADGVGLVGAAIAHPGLCTRDRQLLRQALDELPELWVALRQLITPTTTASTGGPTSGSKTPPLPLRVAPLLVADRIHTELTDWETLVRARTNMRAPRPPAVPDTVHPDDATTYRAAWDVGRAAQLLATATPILLTLEPRELLRWDPDGTRRTLRTLDGVDAACELLNLHQLAVHTAGRDRLVHYLVQPCPRCEHQTLRRDNGDDKVTCATCAAQWPEERYAFFARILLDDLDWAARCDHCDPRGYLPNGRPCPHPDLATAPEEPAA